VSAQRPHHADGDLESIASIRAQVSSSRLRGLFVGVRGGIESSAIPSRAIRFQAALAQAGFEALFIGWQGIGADDFIFLVSYR